MKPKNVDDYIANTPKESQGKLEELRSTIKKAAPSAEESISYGMPYYSYKGRLAYFQLWKHHIGLYIPSPILQEFKEQLKDYQTSMATVRFPLDQKLPVSLIDKLIKARLQKNEEHEGK